MYIYICIYIYVCIYIHIYVLYIYVGIYVYVCNIYAYIFIYTYVHLPNNVCVHTYVCIHIHIRIDIYVYTYIFADTYVCGTEWLRLVGSIKLYVSFAEYCLYFAKKTYNLIDPTNQSHPMCVRVYPLIIRPVILEQLQHSML